MQEYNIVVCLDNNLFDQMLVLFQSAVVNCKKNICFHILQSDFTDSQRKYLLKFQKKIFPNELKLYNVNEKDYEVFNADKRYPIQTYYYVLAHELLPDNLERALYMDCDTYIRKDIDEFYSMEFENNYFVGSKANVHMTSNDFESKVKHQKGSLFNSGILLLNLKKMRKDKINSLYFKKKIQEFGSNDYFADQGLLNYCFWNKIRLVSPYIGNYITSCSDLYEDYYGKYDPKKYPLMVHFAGTKTCKPWKSIIKYNYDNDISVEYFLCKNELKPYVEIFYIEWLNIAEMLSDCCYKRILEFSYKSINNKNSKERLYKNAHIFFEKLANDKLQENRFENWLMRNKNKTFAVLKSNDSAGKFFVKNLKSMDIKVILSNSKGYLKELSAEELEEAKKADVIVQCSVHTSDEYDVYDGVKAININTIFKL